MIDAKFYMCVKSVINTQFNSLIFKICNSINFLKEVVVVGYIQICSQTLFIIYLPLLRIKKGIWNRVRYSFKSKIISKLFMPDRIFYMENVM